MKWQDVDKKLVVGGGSISIIALFSALFLLSGISYNYTGDITCGEICESYINVTTTYWRICFDYYNGTKYENETLFKKQTTSRTLHINLNNINNIIQTEPNISVDWLVPTYGNNWRAIKGGDCWERGETNENKIVGYKEEEQTIKWSFILGDKINIDPKWKGIEIKLNDKLNKTIKDLEKFDKELEKEQYDSKYKEIKDTIFLNLIYNKNSLTYGESLFEFYNPSNKLNLTEELLFDFIKGQGNLEINSYEIYVNTSEEYQEPIYSERLIKKECNRTNNETKELEYYSCNYNETYVSSYENKTKEIFVKTDLIGEGTYKIKFKAYWKASLGKKSVDWIPSIVLKKDKYKELKEDLKITKDEWAWWDASWSNKKQITNLTGSIIRINVTYDSDMQNDFDDIRFTNSSEDAELDYWLESKIDGNSAIFRVKTNNESSIYMYYNNSVASSESNISSVYGSSLISSWFFEEGSGSSATDSKSSHNGTLNSMDNSDWVEGAIGKSLDFDGTNDYIDVGDYSDLSQVHPLTISMWASADEITSFTRVISKDTGTGGSREYISSFYTNKFRFVSFYDGTYAKDVYSTTLTTGVWYHLVGVQNSSGLYVYVNGQLNSSTSWGTWNVQDTNARFVMAEREDEYSPEFYDGKLDEVMIFSESLTPTEIQKIYNIQEPEAIFGEEESGDVEDTTNPTFTDVPSNSSISYLASWSGVDFDATDETLLDSYFVNDSSFTINSTGHLINNTLLGVGVYQLNVSVNDSSNNIASVFWNLTVKISECNITDVIISFWSYNGGKFINGFNNYNCDDITTNTTYGEQVWAYSNGKFIDGIGSIPNNYPIETTIDDCDMNDIAKSIWCYQGTKEINGIQSGESPYTPINSEYGAYLWQWNLRDRFIDSIIS